MDQEKKYIMDDLKVAPIQLPSDSYFEDLKKSILDEIGNDGFKKENKARIIPMYKRWYVWGSAAAILALALLFPWNKTNSTSDSQALNLSSVSNEEIYRYLDENIEDLDSETIAVHLSRDAIAENENQPSGIKNTETSEDFSSKSSLLDHVKDEEILDYLNNDPDSYQDGQLDEYLLIES